MTWQDELQQLDAELAAGQISAEEYRQRRDAVLGRVQAEQSGGPSDGFPTQQPDPGPDSGGATSWPRHSGDAAQSSGPHGGQAGTPQSPFPPAFSWQQYGGDADGQSESTQVVRNSGAQPPAGQGFPQQGYQQQPPSPPGGWPSQGQPQHGQAHEQFQWGQYWGTGDSGGTPWGNSDLPPEHGDTSWMRQGPEVFETVGKSSSKGKTVGITVGGVLMVGLVVAAVFYFVSADEPPRATPPPVTSSSTPTSTTPPLPEPPPAKPAPGNAEEVLIQPPEGPRHPFNGPLGRSALEGPHSGALLGPVREFALNNGIVNGRYAGTNDEGVPVRTTLIAIEMPDEATAERLTRKYLEQQEALAVIDELSYRGVEVYSSGDTLRTAYTSHSWTVIVDVQTLDAPDGEARSLFEDVLSQQLAKTPPTVRE
ncbi:SHOCT domain-containing protein [Actinopolyspora xinjiangensis]|uniref:SHOCT domain-containing protein n=1 Tax=Actinopolyspora xinjiangensis TaxID=405564 RepID=UPI000B827066|nr:SHOCT domain-containing protein [Actinopolyspora xinjiangensis]